MIDQAAHVEHRIGEHRFVQFADHERRVGKRLLQRRVAADVIAVSVRVQNHRRTEFFRPQKIEHEVRLQARVENETVRPVPQSGDVRVLLKRHRDDCIND